MFSSKGLFKHIVCPMGAACRMPNCMFGHDFAGTSTTQNDGPAQSVPKPKSSTTQSGHEQKRRKLDDGTKAPDHASTKMEKKAFVGSLVSGEPATATKDRLAKNQPHNAISSTAAPLKSVLRPISPPPRAAVPGQKTKPTTTPMAKSTTSAEKPEAAKKETLNPRPVTASPEQWGIRTALLEKLHEMMVPLNNKTAASSDPELKALHLDDNALIKAALDEEEKLARTQGKVYKNMIKLRIVAYKKMKLEDWKNHRIAEKRAAEGTSDMPKKIEPKPIETGLTPEQETMFLSRFIANQEGLDKFGYVTAVPTNAEIEQARVGVEASAGHEVCDRCRTRFQVYPDRRVEDGALTSGSHCTFHWGKPFTPQYKRTEAITGRTGPRYSCCQEATGTPGCTTLGTHVFKISEAKRLALVLPFVATPPNPNAIKGRAVCFDCEMGYTVYGLELIRLTATTWPDGDPLIDVLVRPVGTILDLNTRFSGVTSEQFFNALAYDSNDPSSANPRAAEGEKQPPLRITSSPAEARSLLLSYLAPETPLLGHALENDLNSVRLVHPTIVDTVLLFPIRGGLPMRPSLKGLVKGMLGKEIQTAGAAGHDSLEDARSTGDLVRFKVMKQWQSMKSEGWTVRDEGFFAPMPKGAPPGHAENPQPAVLEPINPASSWGKGNKRKRKKGAEEETETEGD